MLKSFIDNILVCIGLFCLYVEIQTAAWSIALHCIVDTLCLCFSPRRGGRQARAAVSMPVPPVVKQVTRTTSSSSSGSARYVCKSDYPTFIMHYIHCPWHGTPVKLQYVPFKGVL